MANAEMEDVFTPEIARVIITRFRENNGFEKCNEIMMKLQRCINKGENALRQMELLVKEINPLHKCMAVTKLGGALIGTGGAVSVIAGVTAGLIGAVTGGIGALPAIAAVALGTTSVASGVGVNAGSDLLGDKIISRKVQLVQNYLSRYQQTVDELKQSWDHVEELCNEISIIENLELTDTAILSSYVWNSFLEMRLYVNCSEVVTALSHVATGIPSGTIELFKKAIEYVVQVLPYAVNQFVTTFRVIIQGERHRVVQKIEQEHLPDLRSQIGRLKTAKDEFARAQNR